MGLCAFSKAALDVLREFENTKPLQIFNPLKILCLEERTPGVLMASKDMYPKGSAMNMIIPVAFIELVVRKVLNGDQTLKKLSGLDTFLVKVISKSSFY